jgi:hypothetical protein
MWCWRRMEISWTDSVRNEEVLQTVNEDSNIPQTLKRKKANWIGHILCRNCLLKHVTERKIEERIEVTVTRGRRRKQVLDDLKKNRGTGNWKRKHQIGNWKRKHQIALCGNPYWKRLWTCRETDCGMNEPMNEWVIFGNGNNSVILPMHLLLSLLSTPFSTTLHLSPYPPLGSFTHIQ